MSLATAFSTLLVTAYTGAVNKLSLHTADPGTTGANDSGVSHASLSWSGPSGGVSTALASFSALTGDFTHVGLWYNATFRQGISCEINYSAAADIDILVTHRVGDDSDS